MHCGQSQVNHSTYTSDLPPLLMQLIHITFLLQWHYQQVRVFCAIAIPPLTTARVRVWWMCLPDGEGSRIQKPGLVLNTVNTHPHMATINIHHHIVTKTIILSLTCTHAWWLCIFTWACCYLCMNCLAEIQYSTHTCTCRILLLGVLL